MFIIIINEVENLGRKMFFWEASIVIIYFIFLLRFIFLSLYFLQSIIHLIICRRFYLNLLIHLTENINFIIYLRMNCFIIKINLFIQKLKWGNYLIFCLG
jgi:hypothetical protein